MSIESMRNNVVLITGGAAGIGRGAALCFARKGANVAIADIDEANGNSTCDEIRRFGNKASFFCTDIQSESNICRMVQSTVEQFGKVDILINNVGGHFQRPIEEITLEFWDQTIATNLRGHFLMTREVIPFMKKQGKGIHCKYIFNTCKFNFPLLFSICCIQGGHSCHDTFIVTGTCSIWHPC